MNDDYKLLVTVVFKTGSENWKNLFKELFERGRNSLQRKLGTTDGIYTLAQLYNNTDGAEKVVERLKNYFSVIFVRHPYSRLLSAYMSKFSNTPNNFYTRKARYIISKVRGTKRRRKQNSRSEIQRACSICYRWRIWWTLVPDIQREKTVSSFVPFYWAPRDFPDWC